MKPYIKFITGLLFTVFFAMFFASLLNVPFIAAFIVLLLMGCIIQSPESALRAVTVEIWQNDIIDNLFKDNQFASNAVNGDQYVTGGSTVHIPTAGVPSKSLKNETVFPITAVKRTDDEIIYILDNYFQPPKYVQNVEQAELSYDKRQSIMGEAQAQLIQDAMDGLLYRWALQGKNMDTPGNSFLTIGGNTAATISGATGNRKLFTLDVFGKVKLAMDRANILPNGRTALLTADHYQQLLDSLSDAARTNFYRFADMQKGIMGNYLGFNVIMRSSVQRWRNIAGVWTPVDDQAAGFGASDQTGDSAASLFWHTQAVERARGDVAVFDNQGQAVYYGDVMSMNMRLGGRQRRPLGVYAVIEDVVAP